MQNVYNFISFFVSFSIDGIEDVHKLYVRCVYCGWVCVCVCECGRGCVYVCQSNLLQSKFAFTSNVVDPIPMIMVYH